MPDIVTVMKWRKEVLQGELEALPANTDAWKAEWLRKEIERLGLAISAME